MVGPIYLVAAALAVAFLLPIVKRLGKTVTDIIFLLTLAFLTFVSGSWLYAFLIDNTAPFQIFTAGVQPPLSINLQMGIVESALLTAANFLALVGGIYLLKYLQEAGIRAYVIFLLFALGMNGLILTRDIFNVFVFLEISSISSYALIAFELNPNSLRAGFRYMVAGNVASIFLLLGVIFLYSLSGTLNIDGMNAWAALQNSSLLTSIAVFMLLFSFLIEMKQFPANGWALDVYQSANPGISAMLSAGSSGAIFFALAKILPLASANWYEIIAFVGMFTFVFSNLMGIKQQNTTRLLGYSSVGQMGLLLAVLGLAFWLDAGLNTFMFILAALFFNHFFAKAGLYWLAGLVKRSDIKEWGVIQSRPPLQFFLGLFIFALLGFPPFAGFWGKWSLVMFLAKKEMFTWLFFLLLGSLLEAVYLLRWFGNAVRGEKAEDDSVSCSWRERIPILSATILSLVLGWYFSQNLIPNTLIIWLPILVAFVFYLLDGLPAKVKGVLVIAVLAGYGWLILPMLNSWAFYFNLLFLAGGAVMTFTTLNRSGQQDGFYPMLAMMLTSLASLTIARDLIQFFVAWELMTLSSYLLIIRGKQAQKPALTYILFSLAGAYSILAGFALAYYSSGTLTFAALMQAGSNAVGVFMLVSLGMLVKVAAIGLHIWAPGSYGEAEDDVTPILSGILSKTGIFGLVVLLILIGKPYIGFISLTAVLGWIGALTALFATLFAVFQEDVKKLLAYSSVGQVGYIVLGLAAMSHLGWAAAMWHTLNHFLFKGLIFLAIAGVIYRVGTRNMYEMGGLIKKMPLSFVSVLMGIIALSGVPPLTGFGGKWLLYEALIEKGWYLQTAVAFFASTIAFLYCFRLIHTVFLGMPKPNHNDVKEAPLWFIIPQYILIAAIMVFSVYPQILLQPISEMINPVFASTLNWQGHTVFSSLGYWNGMFLMIMTGVVFVLVTLYLLIAGPRPQKVKAFNIVFAAERPERPETTHYAYQFFSPYQRAMAPVLKPLVKRFWFGVSEWTHSTASVVCQIYSGNLQTYTLFIFLFGVILYLFSVGVH